MQLRAMAFSDSPLFMKKMTIRALTVVRSMCFIGGISIASLSSGASAQAASGLVDGSLDSAAVVSFSPAILLSSPSLPQEPASSLLWRVSSGSNSLYLFGSIHLAKANFYPLPAAVELAYAQADLLAVEADVTDTVAAKNAMPLMQYASPDNLQHHLSAPAWRRLQALAGPATQQLQAFKPAVVTMGLVLSAFTRQGYDPAYGIDLHFIQRAKSGHKKILELESLAFQAGVLGQLNDAEGEALLTQALDSLQDGVALRELDDMVAAWKSGDAAVLAQMFADSANKDAGSKKLMKLLLDERNVGMAQKIQGLLRSGSKALVVVGAGHLVGTNSIIELLQKQGWQVQQVK